MDDYNIAYFRNLWETNVTDLQNRCNLWEKICVDNVVPDEVHDEIRTNIGLARLLMGQKLKQFSGLIDDSEFNTGEKEITYLDLQGFWDMVYNEVEKIKKCFDKLEKCKNNEWRLEENLENLLKKKVHVKKAITLNKKVDSSKSRVLAAKQRLAEAKRNMLALREQQKEQNFVEIIQSNKEGFNHNQYLISEDNGKALNVIELNNTALEKESSKKIKQSHANRNAISSSETNGEIIVQKNEIKSKASLRKGLAPSVQNKENFMPVDDNSNMKCISKAQPMSKESTETLLTEKRRGKSKDYGKLQCVTRSAMKALLAQQNTMPKS